MPLAASLVVCALVAWPAIGGVCARAAEEMQESQPPQGASQPEPTNPPAQESQPQPSATPPQTPEPESTQQPGNPQPNPPENKPAPSSTATKSKHHSRKHKTAAPGSNPNKRVVRNGSTTDPIVQISPSLTAEQASHQRQSTTQLLATTDANLKKISGRQLNPSQQDMVNQIHKYMEQAKTAEDAGDLARARNLAIKARLLSDELLKH